MWEYHDPYHPAADELYHFKYIKRVQGANGKWQYYYDRDALKTDARRAAANVRAHVNTAGWYAKKGVKNAASYAKGAARNARNNAIRRGVDARNSLDNARTRLGWAANKAKRKINTAKFVAGRRIDSAKSAARDSYNNAKSAISKNPLVRNVRNNATRMGVDARNSLDNARTRLGWAANKVKRKVNTAKFKAGRRIDSAKSTASNWVNAKITTAVQKRARRRKGWKG